LDGYRLLGRRGDGQIDGGVVHDADRR
jgi:hypothetical protein